MPEIENPYKFRGPLDPMNKKIPCVDKKDDVERVIRGIKNGDYWAIVGPRQIGKTTFLNLVKKEISENTHDYYIYFDFDMVPKSEKEFYQWLIDQFLANIPRRIKGGRIKYKTIKSESPEISFFNFLKNFRPKDDKKRIILIFDEIDKHPFLTSFLLLWRKVYHERPGKESEVEKRQLSRYAVITSGAVEIIKAITGPTSPFNVAQDLHLRDFSEEESEELIQKPLTELNINLKEEAKKELLSQISGHPQLLQHACYLLVETARESSKSEITKNDVDNTIKRLYKENSSLKTLKKNIKEHNELKKLLENILIEKNQIKFHPNIEFELLGVGAIKEDRETSYCKIRNPIYEKFIMDILNNPVEEPDLKSKEKLKEEHEKEEKNAQISTVSIQSQAESPPGKRKKFGKILVYIFGGSAIVLIALSIWFQNSELMFGGGISAALALGLLTVLPGEEKRKT
ncbi:MAG: AAA family ATPase [Candidatus Aminicenantes bacterium]|nr:AAA family ATPase [Candidatus Aminicenantes bacterium]